jgi:uncharacterized protein DUF4245
MEPAQPAAPTAPAAPRSRSERSPRDMALSLAVLLVPIALLLIFYRVVLEGDSPANVDPAPAVQEAQQAKLFPVAVPTGLGKDWHVSAATFRRLDGGATLRIGYVDPGDDPLQLVESSIAPEKVLPAELGDAAKPSGMFRSEDRAWRLYTARPGEQALVLTETGRTIVIVGRTDAENLEKLAASLS